MLVGPNNAGKSTVITAFRILAEAMRKARSRNPELLDGPDGQCFGYRVSLSGLPVAAENIFSDYDESRPAIVKFRISNGNQLVLYFPERESCMMFLETVQKPVRSTAAFRTQFDCEVAFVPVLGPVEHDEPLYQKDAARLALISHRASRNFRNIWHHYPDRFDEFREMLIRTWPGMDIEAPAIDRSGERARLHMFCEENRIPRELYWVGFGFQVWCQMLTFILEGQRASLLAIDEPEIYLHSDLQRQLLGILKQASPDILIATHSTELVSESDPSDIVVVTRGSRSGRRLKNPSQLPSVFNALGSNLNPILTQIAKTKRALFVEGKDYQIIARFAERMGFQHVANRSHIAVIPAGGFNPQKVADVSAGIEATLGSSIMRGVVFDRDYRCQREVEEIEADLNSSCQMVRIHGRKEIENFLLVPLVLERAVRSKLADRQQRVGSVNEWRHDVAQLLDEMAQNMQINVQSQCLASYVQYCRSRRPGYDQATLNSEALTEFEQRWSSAAGRLCVVPGKELFARLNTFLMEKYDISLSPSFVVRHFERDEIPVEMQNLVREIDAFNDATASDD